jgi:hypothetical protein
MSVLTRATLRNNPEDTILHSQRRENLKYYLFEEVRLDREYIMKGEKVLVLTYFD